MENKKLISILVALIIYLLSTGASYTLFQKSAKRIVTQAPVPKNGEKLAFDPSLPKTEECPLNGAMYSTQQRDWWKKHRPLGVMIENHEESRPQSGLSSADVIYEVVAEGAITRFLVVYYCQDAEIVGPVRSARTYFLDFISEYGDYPLYAHVGGANTDGPADALGQINDYGWQLYNDLSQFNIGFPDFFQNKTRQGRGEVATEHTTYSRTATLWKIAKERKLTNLDEDDKAWDEEFVSYSFKEDAATSARGKAANIHIEHWEGFRQYMIDWHYDKEQNIYKRDNAGKPHVDRNTNKQLTTKNLVVLYMVETHANDGYENNAHLLYKTKGSGKAVIFMDGKKITGTWKKASRTARTLLFDESGSSIKFNRGTIWFEVLPLEGVVTVK